MIGLDGSDGPEVPPALLAVAVKVYAVPFVRLVSTQDDAGTVITQVELPLDAVTAYEVGGPPPNPGATVMVAEVLPATATGARGGTGTSDKQAPEVITPLVEVLEKTQHSCSLPSSTSVRGGEPKTGLKVTSVMLS